jgi:hypothetical protein
METTVELPVSVEFVDIARALTREQKRELIINMCEDEQDVDFEIDIAKLMLQNLKGEFTNSWDGNVDPEFKQIVKEIKRSVK